MAEPGTIIGNTIKEASLAIGIKPGIAVIASRHDTQFAIMGSGAGVNQPVCPFHDDNMSEIVEFKGTGSAIL